jgi:hypothetical protein
MYLIARQNLTVRRSKQVDNSQMTPPTPSKLVANSFIQEILFRVIRTIESKPTNINMIINVFFVVNILVRCYHYKSIHLLPL